jgi:hypothetical protein
MLKGVEGLPLKYIAVILVAALVIGVVVSVITTFTGTATTGAGQLNQTVNAGLTAKNMQTCENLGCTWNTTNSTCVC